MSESQWTPDQAPAVGASSLAAVHLIRCRPGHPCAARWLLDVLTALRGCSQVPSQCSTPEGVAYTWPESVLFTTELNKESSDPTTDRWLMSAHSVKQRAAVHAQDWLRENGCAGARGRGATGQ